MAKSTKSEGKISKSDAVRAAMKANITDPTEAVAYILEHYGVTLSKQQFSNYRSIFRGRLEKLKEAKRAAPSTAESAAHTPAPKSDVLATMESLKGHVDTLGADQVIELVKMLGK